MAGTNLYWVRLNGGDWNADPSADPATFTGGIDISATTGRPMAPMVSINAGSLVCNFGQSAFSYTVPSGYTAGWPTVTTGWTTLDPASQYNVGGAGSLSNGNLTATGTLAQSAWFGADFHKTGFYYFEITTHFGSLSYKSGTGVGVHGAALLDAMLGTGTYDATNIWGGGNLQCQPLLATGNVNACSVTTEIDALCPANNTTAVLSVAVALYDGGSLVALYPMDADSSEYGLSNSNGADFPTSFSQFSLSVWCCNNVTLRAPKGVDTPYNINMEMTPFTAFIEFTDVDGNILFSGHFHNPGAASPEYHVMFSVDTMARTYTLWVSSNAPAVQWTSTDAAFGSAGNISNVVR